MEIPLQEASEKTKARTASSKITLQAASEEKKEVKAITVSTKIPLQVIERMKKQGYHLVGSHSAVKQCEWTRNKLVNGEGCYKHSFYGINSHQCIQGTAYLQCFNSCSFCWRMMPEIHEQGFNGAPATQWDSPKEIVDGFIREQQRIVSGYGGNERVKKELLEEAKKPRHVALSLTGETILYAHLL